MPHPLMRRVVPLLLLAACNRSAPPADAPPADTAVASAAAPAAATPADSAPEQLRFNSTIADFEFAIPQSWGRRYTVSERSAPDDYPRAQHVVEFMYLPDEGGIPPTLLAIADYNAADWQAAKAGIHGGVVAEKGGRVWVAVPAAKETPLAKGSPDAQRFDAARITVAQAKAAMTLK